MSANSHIPSYRLHRQSGQAIVTLTDATTGRRRDVLLGKHGTAASKSEYKRVVLEWEASERRILDAAATADLTISELIARYWQHVETYYRHADGTATGEVQCLTYALRPLNYLHGSTFAAEFRPSQLEAVRALMIRGYDHPKYGMQKPSCRTQANAKVKRIRRLFRWAVKKELIPAAVLIGLETVDALKLGRTVAKESKPVLPVARAIVEDTLPLLRPQQADMVMLQLETGMRPGELVVMRACDIDVSGEVWLYRPNRHKTAHHGHVRVITIGPKGQEIVRRYLVADTQAFMFSPARNMEERAATMRLNRKTRVQPSQANRKKAMRKRKPGDCYTVTSYARGIAEAIKRHNVGKPANEHIPHWHLHQLRHTRADELRRSAGLDAARAVLGHRSPVLTEHYAGLDIAAAVDVMRRIG